MKKIAYKISLPLMQIGEKIQEELKEFKINSTIKMDMDVIPRKLYLHIEIDENTSAEDVFELGALVGTLDTLAVRSL
jgi:hypothetical protein